MNHSHRLSVGLAAACPYSQSTAIAGKKCDELEMEDEEGYTALNLRPSASVITPGYSSRNKCSAFKAPASCVATDSKYRWKLAFKTGHNLNLHVHVDCFRNLPNFVIYS